jgi:hypothetical protein
MIDFLIGGLPEFVAGFPVTGHKGLPLVECLGRDFTGMVDAHEAGDMPPAGGIEWCFFNPGTRCRAGGVTPAGQYREHIAVEFQDELVQGTVYRISD